MMAKNPWDKPGHSTGGMVVAFFGIAIGVVEADNAWWYCGATSVLLLLIALGSALWDEKHGT